MFMLIRKDVASGSSNVRFFDSKAEAMEQGRRLERIFDGSDWWVAEVHYTAYAPRQSAA